MRAIASSVNTDVTDIPTACGSAAERLAKATQRAARSCGIDVERRPWRAHVSIARLRGERAEAREALTHLAESLADYEGPAWTADHIMLVHSKLGPQPVHTPIDTFAFCS